MIDIDNDVSRKPVYSQFRIAGEFFKSGCSLAPSHPPKVKEGQKMRAEEGVVHPYRLPMALDPEHRTFKKDSRARARHAYRDKTPAKRK